MAFKRVEEFPQYMELGSRGPAVNLVLALLLGWAKVWGIFDHGVVCDGVYRARSATLMKKFQELNDLESDGGCGPETRKWLKEAFGFDLELAARTSGGDTSFVQPDGEEQIWSYVPE
jgi:hypothetical protein